MRYAVISDIHANLDALERVLSDARNCGAERVVCLGDVVGYGPRPAECVARVRAACGATVAGNHDDAVSGRLDASDFIDLAGDAVRRHREALSPDALAWLASLPYTCDIEGAAAAHGDLAAPRKFYYVNKDEDAAANFEASPAQLMFVGHTHAPCIYLTGHSGAIYRMEPQDFLMEDGKRYIVNPGSVGYPREKDGKCMSSYVIYDTSERTVRYRFLPFSVASVMQRGQSPKRIKKRVLIAAGAAIALLAGALAWFLVPRPAPGEPDAALVVERRDLAPLDGCRHLRANLRLDRGSVPVKLRIRFLGSDGETLSDDSVTVKSSSTKAFGVPDGAKTAVLTASRMKEGDEPRLLGFSPTASME